MHDALVSFIREQYRSNEPIPLHAPVFVGRERQYVAETIESTFVSSVGAYVTLFEKQIADYTKSPAAVATVNGTSALHIALKLVGVKSGDLVLTQPLTFVATCNAIAYCGAEPVFVDIDCHTLGLSPQAMVEWLDRHAFIDADGECRRRKDRRKLSACLPMHTFGHPVDLDGLIEVCKIWQIALVEDAAESLGSIYKGRHTGTFGQVGALSFNGNKIITTGGGGMILADVGLCTDAKHLTTTAKLDHPYKYFHDDIGYNYRMPNINAALGSAQVEQLENFIANKRELASRYASFFEGYGMQLVLEPTGCRANYWLNAVVCANRNERDKLLKATNDAGVMTRPVWELMNRLPSFAHCDYGPLGNAEWFEARLVNLPSSVRILEK